MKFRRTSTLTVLVMLAAGLLAAQPASSAPAAPAKASTPSTLTAARAKGAITGKVTFQGKPVKRAEVYAVHGSKKYRAKTNSKGRFTLKVPARNYKLYAKGPSKAHLTYAGGTVRREEAKKIKVRAGRTVKANVKLKKAGTIKGRVLDSHGRPVSADLWINSLEHPTIELHPDDDFGIPTSSDGTYKLTGLPSGRISIHVDGYDKKLGSADVVVTAKNGKTVTAPDIVLPPYREGTLTAKVDWSSCGESCPDTYMAVFVVDESGKHVGWLEENPATGVWKETLRPGTYRVSVHGTNLTSAPVTVTDGAKVSAGTIVVPPVSGVLTGKVLKKDGTPVPKGTVVLVKDSFGALTDRLETAKDGSFRAEHVAPGTHRMYVLWPEREWGRQPDFVTVTVENGQTTTADIRLERGHTVKGTVTHRGKGVEGLTVVLSRGYPYTPFADIVATTNKKGRFTFKQVPTSTFTLNVTDPSPLYRAFTRTLTVNGKVTGLAIKVKK